LNASVPAPPAREPQHRSETRQRQAQTAWLSGFTFAQVPSRHVTEGSPTVLSTQKLSREGDVDAIFVVEPA